MNVKKNYSINSKGKLLDLAHPKVMGIINLTEDSFFKESRVGDTGLLLDRVDQMIDEGVDILDIGAMSSRPGAKWIEESVESNRITEAIEIIRKRNAEIWISVDTFRSTVGERAIKLGADLINDISAGGMDDKMFDVVASLNCPYIMMHMQGNPSNMQQNPRYENITKEILQFFVDRIRKLQSIGLTDIIIDPGFGFGKTIEHNYTLLKNMHIFSILDKAILCGISRKSMIYKTLNISPGEALNGSTALHMVALQQGAKILRVHDVKAAKEVIKLFSKL